MASESDAQPKKSPETLPITSSQLGEIVGDAVARAIAIATPAAPAGPQQPLQKAGELGSWGGGGPVRRQPRTALWDPFSLIEALGYKERATYLTYDVLDLMASRDATVAAILTTRLNQIASFTVSQDPGRRHIRNVGFYITLRDKRVRKKRSLTKEECKESDRLRDFVLHMGVEPDRQRPKFEQWMRMTLRDALVHDQQCSEIIPDKKGKPYAVWPVDASTIRIAQPEAADDDTAYIQLIQGKIHARYRRSEMIFGVMYPRTKLSTLGYGYSPLEQLVTIITAHLWAEEYNRRYFQQGSLPKGILNIKGSNVPDEMLEAFRRQWYAQVAGVMNAWKTPVMNTDEIQYIPFDRTNQEMEFGRWIEYLINIACAVFQIDPAEVNFPNRGGAASDRAPMFESSPEARLKLSKDKGLRPLLAHEATLLNEHLIEPLNEDFVLEFTGLDLQSAQEEADLAIKEIGAYKSLNEIRLQFDLDPIDFEAIISEQRWGDLPMSGTVLQLVQQQVMAAQQAQPGGGAPGEGGEEEEVERGGGAEEKEDEGEDRDERLARRFGFPKAKRREEK